MKLRSCWSFVLLSLLFFSGCSTLKVSSSTDFLNASTIEGNSLLGVRVEDKRAEEGIGTIGAGKVTVLRQDALNLVKNQAVVALQAAEINPVFSDNMDVAAIAKEAGSQKVLVVEIKDFSVSSMDLLLDKPEYDFYGLATVYSKSGALVLKKTLQGRYSSRSMRKKTIGEAVGYSFGEAMENFLMSEEVKAALK